jgi:hypothetical protein
LPRKRGVSLLFIVVATSPAIFMPSLAIASFCPRTVRDYAAPLKRLRPVHHITPAAPYRGVHPHFAPPGVRITERAPSREKFPVMLTAGGSHSNPPVQFGVLSDTTPQLTQRLKWRVVVSLVRFRGDKEVTLHRKGHELLSIKPNSQHWLGFRIPRTPGLFLVEFQIRSLSGKSLGRYGQYVRAMRRTLNVRLDLRRPEVTPGDTIVGCLQNIGTVVVDYGQDSSAIQMHTGTSWEQASFGFPWPRYDAPTGLGPGTAKIIGRIQVPAAAPLGSYRWVWTSLSGRKRVAAEFTVGLAR